MSTISESSPSSLPELPSSVCADRGPAPGERGAYRRRRGTRAVYLEITAQKQTAESRRSRFRGSVVARGRNAGCIPRYRCGLSEASLRECSKIGNAAALRYAVEPGKRRVMLSSHARLPAKVRQAHSRRTSTRELLKQESVNGIAEDVRVAFQDAAQLDSGTLSRIVLAKRHDGKASREA